MHLGAVCAVISESPGRPDLLAETRAALEAQEPAPLAAHETLDAALATGAEWIWLLDGVTVPAPDALAAFAGAVERLTGLPEPLVLAGRVLDTSGELHPDALPRHEIFEKQLTVEAIERGMVQLRAAPSGSLLLRREAFERFGPLRTDLPPSWAAFAFTARALQSWDDTGHLVPSSVAVRKVPPRPTGRRGGALRTRARLLAGPTWTPTERLWEGFLVAEDAVRDARGRARRATGRRGRRGRSAPGYGARSH